MWATWGGSLETVTLLLNRGANIHARDNIGDIALMIASHFNYANIISYSTDKGMDIHGRVRRLRRERWEAKEGERSEQVFPSLRRSSPRTPRPSFASSSRWST